MILNRKQIQRLDLLFEQNSALAQVNLVEESKSGIGVNLYAEYISPDDSVTRIDITNYDLW